LPLPGAAPGVPIRSPWHALVQPRDYNANFARLQNEIADGETYQANYTVPFECGFAGASEAASGDGDRVWFAELARAQGAGFCAWLDLGRHRVLSLSPELFFRLDGSEILARPMKGTARRTASGAPNSRLRPQPVPSDGASGEASRNRARPSMRQRTGCPARMRRTWAALSSTSGVQSPSFSPALR